MSFDNRTQLHDNQTNTYAKSNPLYEPEPFYSKPLAQSVGEKLKSKRLELCWSLEDVAKACKIDLAYLSRIERGERRPSPSLLAALAKALKLPEAELGVKRRRKPGRPKGSKDKKPRNVNLIDRGWLPRDQMRDLKRKITDLLESRTAKRLTDAAKMVGLSPRKAYQWKYEDKDWQNELRIIDQIEADELENELEINKSVVRGSAIAFRLKKLRPEYRDNYRFVVTDYGLKDLITELKQVTEAKQPQISVQDLIPAETTAVSTSLALKGEEKGKK